MNDLIRVEESLPPATIEELQEWIIVTKERLNAHKAKIRAIEKVGAALAAKEAALEDGQRLADLLLDAEVRLGEMLEQRPNRGTKERTPDGRLHGETPLPESITKKQSHEAQEIARHPEAVAEAKEEARKERRIATSRDVYQKIQDRKQKSKEPSEEDSNNLFQLKLYWRRANKRDQAKFMKWAKNNDGKEI